MCGKTCRNKRIFESRHIQNEQEVHMTDPYAAHVISINIMSSVIFVHSVVPEAPVLRTQTSSSSKWASPPYLGKKA